MFRNKTAGSILSNALTTMAIAGVMGSCSGVESSNQKNAAPGTKPAVAVVTADSAKKAPVVPPKGTRQLVVYYFHGNARCPTCFKLENFAKSEVEADFADAIKEGTLTWKTVNIEDKGNEHFGQDYKLHTKSVIVSILQDGKETSWKNLEQIWQLVGDESKYREYIKKEVSACLDGKCL